MNGIIGLGYVVDRLSICNIKISLLEGKVRNPESSNEEAGIAAKAIRKINDERNALREVLDKWSGMGFEEIKAENIGILNGGR